MSNLFSDLPVVIIEDTPTKQAKLDGLLEALGVEDIQSFDNGQEGLSALSQGKDKIILFLDLVLPEINGQEILQQLARSGFKGYVVINSVCERRIVQT
ncbi:two-component system response regulator, partial [Oleiphilus sp. HI0066]|uniref:response regulator n=2 Tax=Oleiphilus TaxID=141450 RepID=UPI000A4C3E5D